MARVKLFRHEHQAPARLKLASKVDGVIQPASATAAAAAMRFDVPPPELTRQPVEIPPEPITCRHLLYHVYPRKGGDWRARILAVRERIGLFNGKRVFAIAHDGTTEHPVMVRDALAGMQCDVIEIPNQSDRREVETFLPLFNSIADRRGNGDATLYGHAKGVTRVNFPIATRWAEAIEHLYLDHWHVIDRQLSQFAVAGCFKKEGHGWHASNSNSDWHYSGSWFWFRNSILFNRDNWRSIDQFWGGIEPYPSLHFGADQAGVIFLSGRTEHMNLYQESFWNTRVYPELSAFNSAALETRRAGMGDRLNVGCGPFYAEGWWNTDFVSDDKCRPDEVVSASRPLPFDPETFRHVYMGHVLEHIEWDRVIPFLVNVRGMVKSGGSICVLGPDLKKALSRLAREKNKQALHSHVWEIAEDWIHRQHHAHGQDRVGLRHIWNCYAERMMYAVQEAGFQNVRIVRFCTEDLAGWPVVDFTNPDQSAVIGDVP
jgi:predicted SAM-dependent methyltransferase